MPCHAASVLEHLDMDRSQAPIQIFDFTDVQMNQCTAVKYPSLAHL